MYVCKWSIKQRGTVDDIPVFFWKHSVPGDSYGIERFP